MLSFDYTMELDFEGGTASEHAFTLRCLPQETAAQHIRDLQVRVRPNTPLSYGTDSFGNRYCFGLIHGQHSLFDVHISGMAEHKTGCFETASEAGQMLYRQFTQKTTPGPAIRSMYGQLGGPLPEGGENASFYVRSRALQIRDLVHSSMIYMPGVTSGATSAEEAAQRGKGVCQDYTHIALSLCRMSGIPCRYTAGLLIGEGLSHAWVEVCDEGRWIPMDPTNPDVGGDDKLIFSHGRDAADCLINRGVYLGSNTQIQKVSARLQNQ